MRETWAGGFPVWSSEKQPKTVLKLHQSLRVVKWLDSSYRKSHTESINHSAFRNSSFFGKFFKNFVMNIVSVLLTEKIPLSWRGSIFLPKLSCFRVPVVSWLCASALWQEQGAWLFGTPVSSVPRLPCICNNELIRLFRTCVLSPLGVITRYSPHFRAQRSPVASSLQGSRMGEHEGFLEDWHLSGASESGRTWPLQEMGTRVGQESRGKEWLGVFGNMLLAQWSWSPEMGRSGNEAGGVGVG